MRFTGKQTSFIQSSLYPALFILSVMGGQQTVRGANRLLQLSAAAALFISLLLPLNGVDKDDDCKDYNNNDDDDQI